jgi:gamma-glutamylcyclotransferase (GGCT)/AIG2-like uncharacterized protein YtfP
MRFAFYGSLRRSFPTQQDLRIQSRLRFIEETHIRGSLVDLGDFPGLLPGTDPVVAELHEALDSSVIAILDAYEDFDASTPDGSLFIRRLHPVAAGGLAWVYFLNRIPGAPTLVNPPDWVDHLRVRKLPTDSSRLS